MQSGKKPPAKFKLSLANQLDVGEEKTETSLTQRGTPRSTKPQAKGGVKPGTKRGKYKPKSGTLALTKNESGIGAHYKPTEAQRETVMMASAAGIPIKGIASLLGIALDTLKKHFATELSIALDKKNSDVAGFLFQAAKAGNVTAQIFWLKTRGKGKWKENAPEQDDPNKKAVDEIDWTRLTVEEHRTVVALLGKARVTRQPVVDASYTKEE